MISLKKRIAQYFLKKAAEKPREITNLSLSQAESVLLLLPQDEKQRAISENWVAKLKKEWKVKTVDTFFFNYRKPSKKEPAPDAGEINKTHLNWYLKPQHEDLLGSYRKKYDLFIDLDTEYPIPHQFIAVETCAKMKVGLQVNHYPKGFDFVLKTSKNDSIQFVTEQIEKYLSIFEPRKTEIYEK